MSRTELQPDVLVLGEHPAAYLAAALLRGKGGVRVVHSSIPQERFVDRLVLINPALFTLHKSLEPLRRKLDLTAIYGLCFLSDDAKTKSEHRSKSAIGHVASFSGIQSAMRGLAEAADVELVHSRRLEIHQPDETGVDVTLGRSVMRPKALIVAGTLALDQQKLLGLPDGWDSDVLRRYTFLKLKGAKWAEVPPRPTVSMSLDLMGSLSWAWMLPHDGTVQLSVEQPADRSVNECVSMLSHWAKVLYAHGVLKDNGQLPLDDVQHMHIPMAGALAHEGVANRTLLIGPAGGFYSACGEDIYPNCWSALYAADVMKKALKELHLQDALQPFRQRWRTTLGDYLRGPQQNLRFLLPLVYRNQVMTQRLSESILLGKSVVR